MHAIRRAAAMLAVTAAPLTAQDHDAFRRAFTFFGDDLVIEVAGDGPGSLRLLRGGRATLEVAGRAGRALLAAAPPGQPGQPLRLSAAGSGRADWIITVPEGVRVQVRTPDAAHVVPALGDAPTWRWQGRRVHRRAVRRTRGEPARGAEPAFAFTDTAAPDTVALADISRTRRLIVRYQGDTFGVAASAGVAVNRTGTGRLDIAPHASAGTDLLIILPAGTTGTRVIANGTTLVQGAGETGCSPVTVITLEPGTRVLEFTPARGGLRCEP